MKSKLFLPFAGFIIIITIIARTVAFRDSPLKNEMSLNDLQKNEIKVEYINHSEVGISHFMKNLNQTCLLLQKNVIMFFW